MLGVILYLCIMKIPIRIRRRYSTIDGYCDGYIADNTHLAQRLNMEAYIIHVCKGICYWFWVNFDYQTNNFMVEHLKYFIYMFRTKLSVFWENYK